MTENALIDETNEGRTYRVSGSGACWRYAYTQRSMSSGLGG